MEVERILRIMWWVEANALYIFLSIAVTTISIGVLYSLHVESQRFNFSKRRKKK